MLDAISDNRPQYNRIGFLLEFHAPYVNITNVDTLQFHCFEMNRDSLRGGLYHLYIKAKELWSARRYIKIPLI